MSKCNCGKNVFVEMYGTKYCFDCFLKMLSKNNKEIKITKMETKNKSILHKCKNCNQIFDDHDLIRVGDIDDLYCPTCADKLFDTCTCCDEYTTAVELKSDINGSLVCSTCLYNYYTQCSHCKHYVYDSADSITEVNGLFYCPTCLAEHCVQCVDCNSYVEKSSAYTCANGETICSDCYDEDYFTCASCNEVYYYTDQNGDGHGNCYCPNCFDTHCDIHRYDYRPNQINFYGEQDRNKNLHIGIELEIQGDGYMEFINSIKNNFSDQMFYLKADGSLNDYGVEIVSHPMTYEYIMNNTDWYKVFRYMEKHYMNDIDNCGLHFHLDRNYLNDNDITLIDYIVNNFSEYFSAYGGRDFDECTEYCKKVNKKSDDWGRLAYDESRYQAVNLTNTDTVELRFCKATDDFETFINRVKMIFAIVAFAKKHDLEKMQKLNLDQFKEIFTKFMNDNFFKDED